MGHAANRRFGAASHHDFGIIECNQAGGIANGMCTRGAGP